MDRVQSLNHHGIRVIRKTMAEMHVEAKLEERNGKRLLMIDGQEVAVAYYRSAYTPVDYPTEQEWLGS
ncbi:hypothetical protein PINS_up013849 [Pythium insidiosum]|nr:hypothetical protein PINS_up013849 [Pythium insidiosum]